MKAKRGSKKQGTVPSRVSEPEREVKPVEEWIILNPIEDEHDKGTVRFAVNMYGSDFGDEEEPQYPTQQDLHADGAGDMIDSYIQDECNFSPWTELLGMKKQEAGKKPGLMPWVKQNQKRAVGIHGAGKRHKLDTTLVIIKHMRKP